MVVVATGIPCLWKWWMMWRKSSGRKNEIHSSLQDSSERYCLPVVLIIILSPLVRIDDNNKEESTFQQQQNETTVKEEEKEWGGHNDQNKNVAHTEKQWEGGKEGCERGLYTVQDRTGSKQYSTQSRSDHDHPIQYYGSVEEIHCGRHRTMVLLLFHPKLTLVFLCSVTPWTFVVWPSECVCVCVCVWFRWRRGERGSKHPHSNHGKQHNNSSYIQYISRTVQ